MRLQTAVHADVAAEELVGAVEAELRGDAADVADARAVVERRRSAASRRLCMNITPSMNCTRWRSHSASISRTSSAVTPTGFSTSTCLPARGGLEHPLLAQAGGERDVDRVDVGAAKQLAVALDGVRALGCGHAAWHAATNARLRSSERLATATSDALPARRIACQFFRAMPAVPRMPQRQTFDVMWLSSALESRPVDRT